ncbi:MAG: FMN-binding negative transcriptional regulator [Burkholderiales bacterium]|nr:FMN-binding negative transcriptional regulator [Burkholderiales bacterium]
MYSPKHFEETRLDVMHDLIRAHPLAALLTLSRRTSLNDYEQALE